MPLPSPALPAGFQVFQKDHIFNTPIDTAPLHVQSGVWMNPAIGFTGAIGLAVNFGTVYLGNPFGVPYNLADHTTPLVPVTFNPAWNYATQSDPLPAAGIPIPAGALTDYNGDFHVLVIDTDAKILHEFYNAIIQPNGSWLVTHYSRWDLTSNALRPDGWTSGNAAGTPIFPFLVRYDEIAAGAINHALSFIITATAPPHLWPARHDTATSVPPTPPLGMRVRLKASFDVSKFTPTNQIILNCLKKYGMYATDNGVPYFLQGAPNAGFNDSDLHILRTIPISTNFEVVDTSSLMVNLNSGQALQSAAPPPLGFASTVSGSKFTISYNP